MTVRLFIVAALLLGIYGGSRWAAGHGIPAEPARLEMKAEDLPTTLGQWKGEDVALDPEMFTAIEAKMVRDRKYRDAGGRTVLLHMAVFEKTPMLAHIMHPPYLCYPAAGWRLGDPKDVILDQGGAKQNVAQLLPVDRRGEKNYVLYWYQIDGKTYYEGNRQRDILLACRGRPFRPPVVKFMLHTTATDADEAEKTMKSLASEVYKWSRDFH
jgi:EpsI family protein